MRVHQLMSQPANTCRSSTDLADVAMMMWNGDCGVVPVVEESGRLLGVVTDRDICIALATRHLRAEETTAGSVMREQVFTVEPHQDVKEAMRTMARERIRRLPVLGEDGRVVGMLTTNDLILSVRARERAGSDPTAAEVMEMLQAICAHPQSTALAAEPGRTKARSGVRAATTEG